MEGGNPLVEYLIYGILWLFALALGALALRSAWFFLSLLAIPFVETVGRWRPFRGAVERWGERGAARDPELWAARLTVDAAPSPSPAGSPRAMRVGMRLGAGLGAVPGIWLGVRGAMHAGNAGDAGWALVTGLGLLGGAGLLVGIALGAGVGLLVSTWRGAKAAD